MAMLKAGLFTRFPKPDFAISFHDKASMPAGKLIYTPGFAFANVDSVDLTIYGRGGHGAYPHATVDPIVIAARTILALQTIVSREENPLDPAVVTVGSIHGGAKHNIIPDEVKLLITVRSYKDDGPQADPRVDRAHREGRGGRRRRPDATQSRGDRGERPPPTTIRR
jgi:hippurate hydrolase